MNKQKCSNET